MFALLIETLSFAMNLKETFGGFPILSFASHALAKHTRVELSVASFSNTIQNTICTSRHLVAQLFFEIRRHAARQSKHVNESFCRACLFRALQQNWDVTRQARNHRCYTDAYF